MHACIRGDTCGPLLCVSRYLGLKMLLVPAAVASSSLLPSRAPALLARVCPQVPRGFHGYTFGRGIGASLQYVCSPCFSRYPSSTSAPNCNSHLEPKRCTLCEYTDNAHDVHMMHYTQPRCIMLALFFVLSVIHFCAQLQLASRAGTLCEYTDDAHDVHMMHYATGGGDKSWIHVKNA